MHDILHPLKAVQQQLCCEYGFNHLGQVKSDSPRKENCKGSLLRGGVVPCMGRLSLVVGDVCSRGLVVVGGSEADVRRGVGVVVV